MSDLKQQFARGMMWNSLSVGSGIAAQTVGGIVLGIFVSREEMRLVGLVGAIVTLPYLLSEMGLTIALIQAREIRPVHLHSIFAVNLIVGFALAAYCVILGPVSAWFFKAPVLQPVLIVMALIFLFLSLGLVQRSILARAMNFGAISASETAAFVCYCVVLTYLAWKGKGVWALAIGKLVQQIVETAGLCISARFVPDFRQVNFTEVRPMIRFGMNTAASRILGYLAMNADMILVGKLLPTGVGGDYAFARQVVISPSVRMAQLVSRVAMSVLPRMQDDFKKMARAMCRFDKLQAIVIFPIFMGLFAAAPALLHVVYGVKWDQSIPIIRVLCLGVCLHCLVGVSTTTFYALGRPDVALRYQLRQLAVRPLALLVGLLVWPNALLVCWLMFADRILFAWLYEKKAFDMVEGRWTDTLVHMVNPTLAAGLMAGAVLGSNVFFRGLGATRAESALVLAVQVAVGVAVFAAFLLFRDRETVRELRDFFSRREKGDRVPIL